MLEERISALEGGIGAIATSSGQAALVLAITTILEKGSHLIASKSLYGGSHNLLEYTLPRFGIDTTFVDLRKTSEVKKNIKKKTKKMTKKMNYMKIMIFLIIILKKDN